MRVNWEEYVNTDKTKWREVISESIKKGKTSGMPLEVMELLKKILEEK